MTLCMGIKLTSIQGLSRPLSVSRRKRYLFVERSAASVPFVQTSRARVCRRFHASVELKAAVHESQHQSQGTYTQ